MPLILASASPRRRELLGRLDLPFKVRTTTARELPPSAAAWLSPEEFAWHNALRKGLAVQAVSPGAHILAADTIVTLEGHILGKPSGLPEARRMLRRLGGKTHSVLTAVALIDPARSVHGFVDATQVTFHPLAPALINRYLRAVPVLDKAGAYGIQDRGDWLVETIDGSFSNVMGLPLEKTAVLLGGISGLR